MKQKIVFRMQLNSDKDRSKAMQIASATEGVISVAKKGEDQVEVVGDMIDSVKLTKLIRKKVRAHVSLESVEEVKPKPEEKIEEKLPLQLAPYIYSYAQPSYVYQPLYDQNPADWLWRGYGV